ncbi:Predicted DNA-binding protein with PD1-like DNA-binding motif [Chlamydia trachomatis]|nr:Predicted DNA-binding protein with PD1-like DNA-binding motif [Chlamydia trachomatis]
MEYRKFGSKYLLRLDKGEEVLSAVKNFVVKENIKLGYLNGLGAVTDVQIGLFNTAEKKYYSNKFTDDYEISSLHGNISTMNGEPYLHLHMAISDKEQNTFGGHLNSATICVTGEIVVEVLDGEVDREFSEEIGINLIKF